LILQINVKTPFKVFNDNADSKNNEISTWNIKKGRIIHETHPFLPPPAGLAALRVRHLSVCALVHALHQPEKGPPAAGSGPADEGAEEAERRKR